MPSQEVCDPADYDAFQGVVSMMKGELASTSFHVAWDSEMRKIYSRSIEEMARSYEDLAMSGKLSWSQAASEASKLRNETKRWIYCDIDQLRWAVLSRNLSSERAGLSMR